jgi:multidrug efflux system membrane fusion protein
VTKSAIASAEARLKRAQLNLDYAFVKAPISGRVSRAEITEGNLVEAGRTRPF